MIAIPCITKLGGIISVKYRRTDDGDPKYLSEGSARLYNPLAFERAESLGFIAITEGEFDAMILDFFCGIPAVGIPGADTWKAHPEWKELFRGFDSVCLYPDPDSPGMGLAGRIQKDVGHTSVASLPGMDVNDTYLRYGAEYLRRLANA